MKYGLLLFHQGWTDIMNCLAMVTYNAKQYDVLYVVYREDAKPLAEFYSRTYANVKNLYLPHIIYPLIPTLEDYIGIFDLPPSVECIGIGQFCVLRKDKYRDVAKDNKLMMTEMFWIDFYRFFGMDPIIRLRDFEVSRDPALEMEKFKKHVDPSMARYRLYHDTPDSPLERKSDLPFLDLGILTENLFFDCILLMENAEELHLVATVWAAFAYLLDCKYQIFLRRGKKVFVYAKRGYGKMFQYPLLPNWEIL